MTWDLTFQKTFLKNIFEKHYLSLHFSPFDKGQQVCGYKRDEAMPHGATEFTVENDLKHDF